MTGFPSKADMQLAQQVQALQQKLANLEKCVKVDAAGTLTLRSQTTVKIEGGAQVEIKGALIKLN